MKVLFAVLTIAAGLGSVSAEQQPAPEAVQDTAQQPEAAAPADATPPASTDATPPASTDAKATPAN
jgi:hypothetical protein